MINEFYRISYLLISIHTISVFTVIYSLYFNKWLLFYSKIYNVFNIEDENLDENNILKMWLISIQIRYFITDLSTLYTLLFNNKFVKILTYKYIHYHFIESVVCFLVFQYTRNYTFSFICLIWAICWSFTLNSFNIHFIPADWTIN